MNHFTIDELMDKTGNKYVLSEVIAQEARHLKKEKDLTIGYQAINAAIESLMNNEFSYHEGKKATSTEE
ncbi:DNA-directed RNA polymerase subunit omega [Guggenheimella bovis]